MQPEQLMNPDDTNHAATQAEMSILLHPYQTDKTQDILADLLMKPKTTSDLLILNFKNF
jgi:hypothetical protein